MAQDPATLLDADPNDLVATPGARWLHKSCVHELPDGMHLDKNMDMVDDARGVVVRPFEACAYKAVPAKATGQTQLANFAGWALDDTGFAPANDSFNFITGKWLVPNPPSQQNGQLIYIFNSLEDNNPPATGTIMQPVLQWGNNGEGGGSYYQMAGWFVINALGYHSPYYVVQPGRQILGVVQSLSCSFGVCTWKVSYHVIDATTGQHLHTDLKTMSTATKMIRASRGLLERYAVSTRPQYPASGWVQFLQSGATTYNFGYYMILAILTQLTQPTRPIASTKSKVGRARLAASMDT